MGALADYFGGLNRGAVAGTAGAPVDMATLGLNALIAGGGYAGHKLGLLSSPPDLIDKPVLGSDWIADKMRQYGLLKDNPGSTADAWGSATGNLLPTLAAAKAPQIARGLLQAGENLAAPRVMNPQAGAVVWHGSPHKFDAFDASKIGTGEGAQAYGHGLYLAENPTVADTYSKMNFYGSQLDSLSAQAKKFVREQMFSGVSSPDIAKAAASTKSQAARWDLEDVAKGQSASRDSYVSAMDEVQSFLEKTPVTPNNGSLYKVDLPDEHIAKMLDWDKPLSAQPHVLKALQDEGYSQNYIDLFQTHKGSELYKSMAGGEAVEDFRTAASDVLQKQGIPGIRYLDGGSRGAGTGSSNFVVFPGNESMLNIMERNGQPLPKSIAGVDAPDLTPPTP